MLIPTHILLAHKLHRYIKDIYGIELDKSKFVWGNWSPDLARSTSKCHYSDNALFNLANCIKKVEDADIYDDIKTYSYDLGVAFHFIADYFCYAHNSIYLRKNMRPHMIYELKLHLKMVSACAPRGSSLPSAYNSTVRELEKLHSLYEKENRTIDHDIYYTMIASHYLMESCFANLSVKKNDFAA